MVKKATLTSVGTGWMSNTDLNADLNALNDQFDNTLSLDGSTPNSMGADLDMNSNDILNANSIQASSVVIAGVPITASYVLSDSTGNAVTKTGIGTATVDADVDAIRVTGYASAGDGGASVWKRVVAEPSHAGKIQSADGAWWEYAPGPEGINAAAFGVLGNSASTYDTEFGNVLDYAINNNTSPSGLSGWGERRVLLPKGRIRLTSGFTPDESTIGLTIEGQGKYATAIEFESDTAHLFTLTANIAFTLKDMSIIHVDQGAGFGSWTCRMITRSGVGGGNQLHLDNIHTAGWAFIDYNSGTANNDTTRMTYCRFINAQTVMYGRSSQAVINKIEHCTIGGLTTKAFDLAGYGTTVWDTCNIVIDGITLELAGVTSIYGVGSVYTFRDCKWEAANNASHGSGSQTQILNVDTTGQYARGNVTFTNCVYQGGSGTLDAANYPVLSIFKGVNVEWIGGAIRDDARVETKGSTIEEWDDHPRVIFNGLRVVPLPTNLIQTDTPQAIHPAVTWVNCVAVPNMTALNERCVHGVNGRHVNYLSSGVNGWLENGATTDHVLDFGGFKQRIVEIYETSGDKIDDHNTKVYSDSGKLTQVGDNLDVTIANGYANNAEYVAPVTSVANEIVDYLKIEVANGLGSFGTIVVVTDAIPTRGT